VLRAYESMPWLVGAQAPAIACSMADSAALALAPSGPPLVEAQPIRRHPRAALRDVIAEHCAVFASLIETCKLNDVDPLA
jgi:hypothetical protein